MRRNINDLTQHIVVAGRVWPSCSPILEAVRNRSFILSIDVKICGIRTPEALLAATEGGARAVGFVFYSPSPRALTPDIAGNLARMLPTGVRSVGLFVDASDDQIAQVTARVPLDMLQLHGHETPHRVADIRARFGIPVMKAIPVATAKEAASAIRRNGNGRRSQ